MNRLTRLECHLEDMIFPKRINLLRISGNGGYRNLLSHSCRHVEQERSTEDSLCACARRALSWRTVGRTRLGQTGADVDLSSMEFLLKVIALLSSGSFAGAALYVTAVEHPARMSQGALFALQEFRPSHKRAAPLQASLAVICFLSTGAVWWLTNRWEWLAGGALVGTVVAFTLIFIMPTNRLLQHAASTPKNDKSAALLAKWGRLHTIRSCVSVLGFLVLLVEVIRT